MKGEFSFAELEKAKMILIQQVQCGDFPEECASLQDGRPVKKSSPLYKFQPFLDGEGIMRVGGRLQFSDLSYDSKHRILIPKSLGRSCTCCCLREVLCEQCTWSLSPFSPVLRH